MHANGLETQLEFAFCDAGDIEQIVDQTRFQLDVAPDDLEGFSDLRRVRHVRFQLAYHRNHWGEWIAQLV